MKRPVALWLLVLSLVFLALGGMYGGIAMLTDPSGNSLQMAEILPLLPVPDYTLPGLFLLFVMGVAPLFLPMLCSPAPPGSGLTPSRVGTIIIGHGRER
jgi:hypothetical protein